MPELQDAQYDQVVETFTIRLCADQERAGRALASAIESAAKTQVDLLMQPQGWVRGLAIIQSFADFALLPLDEVYILHSHSPFMRYAALFTNEVQEVFRSHEVQDRCRLLESQGMQVDTAQQAVFVRPLLAQSLGIGGEPHDHSWKMESVADARVVCNYLMLTLLIKVWLQSCANVDCEPDALASACGWILLQWLEWGYVNQDAFTPPLI